MDIVSHFIELLKLLVDVIVYVEASPRWWFAYGYDMGSVLVISYATYALRVAVEIITFRLGFGLLEQTGYVVISWLPNRWGYSVTKIVHQSNGYRERTQLFLKRLGYLGLFVAGLIPVPIFGAIGPAIYSLESLHQPWYRFNNWLFGCLLAGGLVKMTIFVMMWAP